MYNMVQQGTIVAVTDTSEISVAELRKNLAEILNDTAVKGQVIYVTRNGRRIAAIVPVPAAEQIGQPPG
jgi:prevent-host-death family protein